MNRAMWDYRKLSLRVALDLIAVDVAEQLTWEWPPDHSVRVQLWPPESRGIFNENAYIPDQYLPS